MDLSFFQKFPFFLLLISVWINILFFLQTQTNIFELPSISIWSTQKISRDQVKWKYLLYLHSEKLWIIMFWLIRLKRSAIKTHSVFQMNQYWVLWVKLQYGWKIAEFYFVLTFCQYLFFCFNLGYWVWDWISWRQVGFIRLWENTNHNNIGQLQTW